MKISVSMGAPALPYPCLMIGKVTSHVYLMFSPSEGTVVRPGPGSSRKVGQSVSGLQQDALELFRGTITLEND